MIDSPAPEDPNTAYVAMDVAGRPNRSGNAPARRGVSPDLISTISGAVSHHWPEYAMEAFGLGLFMVSACAFGVLFEHPSSPVRQAVSDQTARRILMGGAMGLTAIANVYSPWGQRSGAHLNPSVTWTFFRLGKVEPWDAVLYSAGQFVGAVAGVLVASAVLMGLPAHPAVDYVVTKPGPKGMAVAFAGELIMSFLLMSVVLWASNTARLERFTGLFAGLLVAAFISLEAPLSGMSMNPARTFGSALVANAWDSLWIYFTAPPLGMLLAGEIYLQLRGRRKVFCVKLYHHNNKRCIFRCNYRELGA
jgi:aquaporin Z